MSRRSDQRRDAAFALYESDVSGRQLADVLDGQDAAGFTRALAQVADGHRPELEELIGRHAIDWDVGRIAALERAIMLVALAEVAYPEEVPAEEPIPPAGAIGEAVEVAKEYCGSGAPAFVNGVLDAAVGELRQNQPGDG